MTARIRLEEQREPLQASGFEVAEAAQILRMSRARHYNGIGSCVITPQKNSAHLVHPSRARAVHRFLCATQVDGVQKELFTVSRFSAYSSVFGSIQGYAGGNYGYHHVFTSR